MRGSGSFVVVAVDGCNGKTKARVGRRGAPYHRDGGRMLSRHALLGKLAAREEMPPRPEGEAGGPMGAWGVRGR